MNARDLELIEAEFKRDNETNMRTGVITKSLLKELFSKYNMTSYSEFFYDNEPTSLKEESMTLEEWVKYRDNFDPREHLNWIDPYEEGIWELTNKEVRKMAKEILTSIKKESYKEPRFYIGKYEDYVRLYYYGRDMEDQTDYWFTFWNEKDRVCEKYKKNGGENQ